MTVVQRLIWLEPKHRLRLWSPEVWTGLPGLILDGTLTWPETGGLSSLLIVGRSPYFLAWWAFPQGCALPWQWSSVRVSGRRE